MLAALLLVGVAFAEWEILAVEATPGACTPDAVLELHADVVSDGEALAYAWTGPQDLLETGWPALGESQASQTIPFYCPPCPPGEDGAEYVVLLSVSDPEGRQAFDSVGIPMSCADEDVPAEGSRCSAAPGVAALGGLWLAVVGGLRRRR